MKVSMRIKRYVPKGMSLLQMIAVGVLCFCTASAVQGQNLTGTINGVVRDESGAVVLNANVTLSNSETNLVVRKLKTDNGGRYEAPALLVGTYSVDVTMPGFEIFVVKQIKLNVDQTVPIDVVLHVGAVTAQVTVSANQVAPNLENAAADTLIQGKQVTELPLARGNMQLAAKFVF